MKRNLIWAFVIALSVLSGDLRADTVVFDFNNEVEKSGEACVNLVEFDTFLSRRLLSVTTQTARLEMNERQRMVENLFAELDMHAMNFQTPTSMVVKQMMHDVPTALPIPMPSRAKRVNTMSRKGPSNATIASQC